MSCVPRCHLSTSSTATTMISALNQSSVFINGLNTSLPIKSSFLHPPRSVLLLSQGQTQKKHSVAAFKPLHVESVRGFGFVRERKPLIKCEAYEGNESGLVDRTVEVEPAAKKAKIGLYFATWWALNVVFNIYNKKVLNAYPYPWLTSTLSLAAGSLIMLISWATKIAEAPKTDFEFWKTLLPVCMCVLFYCFGWSEILENYGTIDVSDGERINLFWLALIFCLL